MTNLSRNEKPNGYLGITELKRNENFAAPNSTETQSTLSVKKQLLQASNSKLQSSLHAQNILPLKNSFLNKSKKLDKPLV